MDLHGLTGYEEKPPASGCRKTKQLHAAPETPESGIFPTNFRGVVKSSPPQAPPQLTRLGLGQGPQRAKGQHASPKVKAMLRICPVDSNHSSFLSCDVSKRQLTVYDPSCLGHSAYRHLGNGAPKVFTFDAVFSQDSSLSEVCSTSLVDVLQAVVSGLDGCICCYGHARLGKTYTVLGVDDAAQNLGIVPCAISWLFKLIDGLREKTGSRFSVRVSAVEVTGKQETLKDLLTSVGGTLDTGSVNFPSVHPREDVTRGGSYLGTWSEIRAPTAAHAAYYLDAAVAARTLPGTEDDNKNSHLLFTLHVYQYRVDKTKDGPLEGGHTRLHLLDFGSGTKDRGGTCLSLSALGSVLLAIANGQRCLPHQSSKLTHLLRELIGGSMPCCICMIVHVSPAMQSYNETLQMIQLAAKFHRIDLRKKSKVCNSSSDDSSTDGSCRNRIQSKVKMSSHGDRDDASVQSDPDYSSSSEQSCDTVIYVGKNGRSLSDRDLTDNEGPPRSVPLHASNQSVAKDTVNDLVTDSLPKKADLTKADCSQNSSPFRSDFSKDSVVATNDLDVKQALALSEDVRYCPTGREVRPVFEEERITLNIPKSDHSQEHSSPKQGDIQVLGAVFSAGRLRRAKQSRHKGNDQVFKKSEELWIDGPSVMMTSVNETENRETLLKEKEIHEEVFPNKPTGVSYCSPGLKKTRRIKNSEASEKDVLQNYGQHSYDSNCEIPPLGTSTFENDVPINAVEDCSSSGPLQFPLPSHLSADSGKTKKSPKHLFASKDHLACWKKYQQSSNTATTTNRPTPSTTPVHSAPNPVILSGDRTAEWVRSVQDVATSKYVHLLHARKQLFRSMQHKKGKDTVCLGTSDRIPNANTIAVFGHPLIFQDNDSEHDVGNNSPPPDYASCVADGHSILDINENKAGVDLDAGASLGGDESQSLCSSSKHTSDAHFYQNVNPSSLKRTLERSSQFGSSVARLCNPDGASNPNISEPFSPLLPSLHDDLTDSEFLEVTSNYEYDLSSQECTFAAVKSDGLSKFQNQIEISSPAHQQFDSRASLHSPAAPTPLGSSSCIENNDVVQSCDQLPNGAAKTQLVSSFPPKRKSAKRDHFFGMSLFSCVAASSCHLLRKFSFRSSSQKTHQNGDALDNVTDAPLDCTNDRDNLSLQEFGVSGSLSRNCSETLELYATRESTEFEVSSVHHCHSMHEFAKRQNSSETASMNCSEVHQEFNSCQSNSKEGSCGNVASAGHSTQACLWKSHEMLHTLRDLGNSESYFSVTEMEFNVNSPGYIFTDHRMLENEEEEEEELNNSEVASAFDPLVTQKRRQNQIQELLCRQETLKDELLSAKRTLMVEPESWSYDLHVALHMDRDDPSYVEALEKETAILEKRVAACKSRIMVVTVFDTTDLT